MNVEVAAALLGVEVDASKEEILHAFKARSRLVHPDMFEAGSKSKITAEESMKQLNMAKDVMVKYVDVPKADKETNFEQAKNQTANSNAKAKHNVDKQTEEVEITLEEQIDNLRSERRIKIDESRDVMKAVSVMFFLNLAVLLVLVGVLVFIGMILVSGWNWLVAILGILLVVGIVWTWRRVIARYYALTYTLGEFFAHKRESRREERFYRKTLKPEKTEGFIYRAKQFRDKF